MTTGEHLVDISTLTTGTAMDHFLNISTGDGFNIYVSEILEGKLTTEETLLGELTELEVLKGELIVVDEVYGQIALKDIITGKIIE